MVHINILTASNSDNNSVLEKKEGTIRSVNYKSIKSISSRIGYPNVTGYSHDFDVAEINEVN
jgi:hypothetical protein